jgi:hypothetical protein
MIPRTIAREMPPSHLRPAATSQPLSSATEEVSRGWFLLNLTLARFFVVAFSHARSSKRVTRLFFRLGRSQMLAPFRLMMHRFGLNRIFLLGYEIALCIRHFVRYY